MIEGYFTKATVDTLDYSFKYEEFLNDHEIIIRSDWKVQSDDIDHFSNQNILLDNTKNFKVFNKGGTLFTNTQTSIFISGGQDKGNFVLENIVRTNQQRVFSKKMIIKIDNYS